MSIRIEQKTVSAMIGLFCIAHHKGGTAVLCPQCADLERYALERLSKCTFQDVKPACSQCKIHCYSPKRQEQIIQVMRYSGPRIMFRHPIWAALHLLKKFRSKQG